MQNKNITPQERSGGASSSWMSDSNWVRASGPRVLSSLSPEQRKAEEEKELRRLALIAEEDRREREKKEAFQKFISLKYDVLSVPSVLLMRIIGFLWIVEQIKLMRVCKRFYNLCAPILSDSKETIDFLKTRALAKKEASRGQIPPKKKQYKQHKQHNYQHHQRMQEKKRKKERRRRRRNKKKNRSY